MNRARSNSLQPDAADPMACLAYAFFPGPAHVESNRQIRNLMRAWLSLLDRLKKLHQRPDSEIVAPLPDALRQPPPPPSVPIRKPPVETPKNPNTNPPQPEPPQAAKSEPEANKPHPDAPPQQG
jgi:hypothetical protein